MKLLLGMAIAASAAVAGSDAKAQGSANGAAPETDVGEIVVTAQRRAESIQDVPISITALSGDQLAKSGISGTGELTQVTPGLFWARSTTVSQPTIRGIGSRNASAGDEPNVATHLDGVYQPEQSATLQELSNIERVEVLKGPQGTLFGRNATGGAINIVTKTPSFEPEGNLSATYGRFGYYKLSGYFSGPLVADKFAVALAGVKYGDDGYVRNIYLNRDQGVSRGSAFRGKLLFRPSDGLELQLNGAYSYAYDNIASSGQPVAGSTRARQAAVTLAAFYPGLPLSVIIPSSKYETATPFVPYFRIRQYLLDSHAKWDLGFATLSGTVAYMRTRGFFHSASDPSPLQLASTDFTQRTHATFEEVVLTGAEGGRFNWLAGVTALQSRSFYDPLLSNSKNITTNVTGTTAIIYGGKTRSVAGFVEGTYQLTDGLFLTAGARYTRDKKTSYNKTGAAAAVRGEETFDNFSPRGVIRYEFSDRANVYASVTKGFKSGVFNAVSAAGALTPARPEKVTAYEIGLKSKPLRGVTFNAAAFHYKYTDLQVTLIIPGSGGGGGAPLTALDNAPLAKISGLEFDTSANLSEGLHVSAGISILDPEIKSFPNAAIPVPQFFNGLPNGNVTTTTPINVSGNDLIRAPRFTANLGVTYERPLAGGRLILAGNAYFSGKYYTDLLNREAIAQKRYEVINASVSWISSDNHWKLSVFGKNLTDSYYQAAILVTNGADNAAYAKPRWFGATVEYNF